MIHAPHRLEFYDHNLSILGNTQSGLGGGGIHDVMAQSKGYG